MATWRFDGTPRTARRFTVYKNCPLPTPEDRLFFLLCYLKVAALQVAHAALFGMTQPNANKWLHLLLIVLHQTLRELGDAPARHLLALRERLSELQAEAQAQDAAAPLFITMALSDRLSARTTMLSRRRTRAARKSVTT
jgi:hypothetical protein